MNPESSPSQIPCFECESGQLAAELIDYTSPSGRIIPAVPVLRCKLCGDVVIGDEGNRMIDNFPQPKPTEHEIHEETDTQNQAEDRNTIRSSQD